MRSKLLFLILVLVTLAALPCSVSANLVPNPGFENGTYDAAPLAYPEDWGGWNPSAGVNRWVLGDAHTGSKSIGLLGDGNGVGCMVWPVGTTTATSDIPVTDSKNYYVSVWAKGAGGSFDGKVDWVANDGDDFNTLGLGTSVTFTGQATTASWVKYTAGPIQPAAGAGFGRVVFNSINPPEVLMDDVYFDTVPVAGASGVHSPDPANGSTIVPPFFFPECIDLSWTRYKGLQGNDLICKLYWNAGAADMNDVNFESTTELALTEPNTYSCVSLDAEKNYYWRVEATDPNGDNYGVVNLVGPVWHFTTVNTEPEVDAGAKQAKWQDSIGSAVTFQLAPTVNDDGLPKPPGGLTYRWTKTGSTSSGTVTFTPGGATSTVLAPTVTMSDPFAVGDYELTLTVSDDGAVVPGDPCDTVVIRVHANDTTGLEARYDCEEGNPAEGIHDDYSGYDRNPPPTTPVNPPTRRGERMNNLVQAGKIGTTMVTSGGHNAQPDQNPGDLTLGGIVTDGIEGHIELSNSTNGDPNYENWSTWAGPSWACFEDEVTLATWIKVDSDNGGFDDNWEAIIVKGYPGAYRLERNAGTDGVQFSIDIAGSYNEEAGTYDSFAAYGGMNVNDGEWHHVVATYDGAQICVYVDGIEDDCVVTGDAQIALNGYPVTMGVNVGTATPQAFGGMYDEIRIHSIGLPYASDAPEDNTVDAPELTARSVLSIYRSSDGHVSCTDENGGYIVGDINQDCYVDMADIKQMAQEWLKCNDIGNVKDDCDGYGFVYTP